ncbi:MAG TPA: anthrone oxygenase family protein [Actinoplanes sp.]
MRIAVLLAATLTSGMMAGFFYAYSISVMPALHQAGAPVLVEVMQRINVAIINGWFMLCFLGTVVLGAIATILYAISGPTAVFVAALIGTVLYAAQLALTFTLHIPLNNALDAAGTTDPTEARQAFEPRWVPWNHARTLLCTGSFASLCWALTQA